MNTIKRTVINASLQEKTARHHPYPDLEGWDGLDDNGED